MRRLRSGVAYPGSFADDESLALWLSGQDGLSDEDIARIYSEHYSQPPRPRQNDYVDVDNMSYDELLALEERIGFVERTKPAAASLEALPTRRANAEDVEEENECAVCCEAYVEGDELRTLPCFHEFHKCCIDKWFLSGRAGARKCPMCNAEVDL